MKNNPAWLNVLRSLDVTDIFKEKGHGDLRRWSAKRTIGGVIVTAAVADIQTNGLTWQAVVLCAIGVAPLIVSVWTDQAKQTPDVETPGASPHGGNNDETPTAAQPQR